MERSKKVQELVDGVTTIAFGRVMDGKVCVCCGKEPKGFKDEVSKREWEISNLCQKCQDQFEAEGAFDFEVIELKEEL